MCCPEYDKKPLLKFQKSQYIQQEKNVKNKINIYINDALPRNVFKSHYPHPESLKILSSQMTEKKLLSRITRDISKVLMFCNGSKYILFKNILKYAL